MGFGLILLSTVMAAVVVGMGVSQEASADRPVDVLVHGYNDGVRPITAGHIALLESKGYVVEVTDGQVTADQMAKASIVVGWGLNVRDAEAREALVEYVYGGGRLLLLLDTQYSTCGTEERPCWYDFTKDAFGFGFDGNIQRGTVLPAEGSEQHPVWNSPNALSEFSDWCCDAYVGEIIDAQNVKVVATASGQSFKHGVYSTVHDVPAIVVNDNPEWGGGMVIGAGIDMVVGWRGPDMRMFDNLIEFMAHDRMGVSQEASADRPVDVLVHGYNDGVRPITAGHIALLESKGYVVEVTDGQVTADQMAKASIVVGWGLNVRDAEAREALVEYVYGGGRLLLLLDTQYSTCGTEERPCWYDFTKDAFGFGFDGNIQRGTVLPAEGSEQHPVWNSPNALSEFSDWCCDAYVGEIIDAQNVKVVATASGQSFKHGVYSTVHDVPAIVVNDNPEWGGGMVIGAGIDMVVGWRGPDMRMFDNLIEFMVSGRGPTMPTSTDLVYSGGFYTNLNATVSVIDYQRAEYGHNSLIQVTTQITNNEALTLTEPNHQNNYEDGEVLIFLGGTMPPPSKGNEYRNSFGYGDKSAQWLRNNGASASTQDCASEGYWTDIHPAETGVEKLCFWVPSNFTPDGLLIATYDVLYGSMATDLNDVIIRAQIIPFTIDSAYCGDHPNICNTGGLQNIASDTYTDPHPPYVTYVDPALIARISQPNATGPIRQCCHPHSFPERYRCNIDRS